MKSISTAAHDRSLSTSNLAILLRTWVCMRDSSGHAEGATPLRLTIPRCGPGQGVLLLREPTSSLTLNNGH
jgi:hypothetical protein